MADSLVRRVALVSQSARLSFAAVAVAAAALNKQVARDLGPAWDLNATVDAFRSLRDVPADAWPILFRDRIGEPGALGYHTDSRGQPYALVTAAPGWTQTASHELAEMLVDPFGNRLIAGPHPADPARRVLYLVEVSDPSETHSYRIDGVAVSDFYLPAYFDPVVAPGARYSFMGAITAPRQVLPGGYLSFYDPAAKRWGQARFFSGRRPIVANMQLDGRGSLREQVDRVTLPAQAAAAHGGARLAMLLAPAGEECVDAAVEEGASEASAARAEALEAEIAGG